MRNEWKAVTFRLTVQEKQWLLELSEREDRSISGWLRRHIKIAALCAELPGAKKAAKPVVE